MPSGAVDSAGLAVLELTPRMFTVKIETLHLHVTVQQPVADLGEVLTQLTNVRKDIKEFRDTMQLTEQELTQLLNDIDATTSHTGENVQKIADVTQTISTEIDDFLKATPVGTQITDAQIAILQGIKNKAQLASDAGDAQVLTLTAVAAKGQAVTPPPPPPVELP